MNKQIHQPTAPSKGLVDVRGTRRFGSALIMALCAVFATAAGVAPAQAQTVKAAVGLAASAKAPATCNAPASVAGINTCAAQLAKSGGVVRVASGAITVNSTTGPIVQMQGVSFEGVCPAIQFSGDVPDSFWTVDGTKPGTVFQGDGSLKYAFVYNNTPQATADNVNFATGAIANTHVSCFGFNGVGFRQSGAKNIMGLVFSKASDLYIYGPPEWGVWDTNFMHAEYSRIYVREAESGCFSFDADVNATAILIPGNSRADQLFCITPSSGDLRSQCYRFWAHGGTLASLNEIYGTRLQCNNFSRTAYSGTATFTSGDPNIVVPDGTKFTFGSLVSFNSTCGNITAGKPWLVLSVSGNNIQVAPQLNVSGAFTPTATCSRTISTKGMPSVSAFGDFNSKGVYNLSLEATDTEGMQSTVFYVESARHFILNSNELPANLAYTDSTVVLRNSYYNRICLSASSSAGSLDLDAGSAPVTQICGGHYGLVGNGYAPVGVSYNSNDNIGRLSLGAGTSWDLEGRQPGTGLSYIYPLTGIAQHVSTYQTGSLTLTAAMLGVVPFTGSSPATFTLPTISAASEKTSLVGITYEIVNSGSATLTIATDGTQVLNGIAGKTSTTLSAGQVLRIVAVQTGSSTFGWLATPGGTLN